MNQEHLFKTISVELINACIDAIESSIEHFTEAKYNMLKLADFLQEDDTKQINHIAFKHQPKNNEPLCINKTNYIALLTLEQLGINCPSQEQIDTMESIILLAINFDKLNKDTLDLCLGSDNIAKRILLKILKEKTL